MYLWVKTSILNDGMAYTWMVPIDPIMHADLTGKFRYPSRQGNNYVLMAVYNNYVKPIPTKNREAESYFRAYQELHQFFTALGSVPTIVRTDNESSKLVTDYFRRSCGVQAQYVPPNNHHANKAERAIRDFKNHFVASSRQ
jgi:hypothetical protein